ncbi:hypothetical protein [Kitasatospora sp. NPDC058218]|uniref:hypothetical protein n=1 Tax=Kitasatospora sp. NPDC058218 TaxID=3346385 RepID=UPI0036DB3CD6
MQVLPQAPGRRCERLVGPAHGFTAQSLDALVHQGGVHLPQRSAALRLQERGDRRSEEVALDTARGRGRGAPQGQGCAVAVGAGRFAQLVREAAGPRGPCGGGRRGPAQPSTCSSTWWWSPTSRPGRGRTRTSTRKAGALGLVGDDLHALVERARQRALGLLQDRAGPFADPWTAWSPDPAWPLPALPDDEDGTAPC